MVKIIRKFFFKVIKVVSIFFILGAGVLLFLLISDHNSETNLPKPKGQFNVGRTNYYWLNEKISNQETKSNEVRNELIVWIWYPTDNVQKKNVISNYLPAFWLNALEQNRGFLINELINRDLSQVNVHSMNDPKISSILKSYPVIIMRAGLAALTIEYTALAEDLASYGYVVVGFDAPYRSSVVVLSDGKMITRSPQNDPEIYIGSEQDKVVNRLLMEWCKDTKYVLDKIEEINKKDPIGIFDGRLDLEKIGIFGHSLGGAIAAQFCHNDSRCKVGIDLDGAPYGSVIKDGIVKPFMFLLSDHDNSPDIESHKIMLNVQRIYNSIPENQRIIATINGSNHFNFSDGAITKNHVLLSILHSIGFLKMKGSTQLIITSDCIHTFFDKYLMGKKNSDIHLLSKLYPEIRVTH